MIARPGQQWKHPLSPYPVCRVLRVTRSGLVWVKWYGGTVDVLASADLASLGYKRLLDVPQANRERT